MNNLRRLKVINKVISLFDTWSYHKILINMLLDTKMADIIMRNVVETPVFIEKVSEKIKLLKSVAKNLNWNWKRLYWN